MYTDSAKSQSGFFLISIVIVAAVIIILTAILYATGVIQPETDETDINTCEAKLERCEATCRNDVKCKSDCLTGYQQCKTGK